MPADVILTGTDTCLHLQVCTCTVTHARLLGFVGFVHTHRVYMDGEGRIFKPLILTVWFAVAGFREFLGYCGLMGVVLSVSAGLFQYGFPFLTPSSRCLSRLPPSLPACLCPSLPLPLSPREQTERETGAASSEKRACACGLAGSRRLLSRPCGVLGGKCNVGAGAVLQWGGEARVLA